MFILENVIYYLFLLITVLDFSVIDQVFVSSFYIFHIDNIQIKILNMMDIYF